MSYTGDYLVKQGVFHPEIDIPPHPDTDLIVVIPCYNEPDFLNTLDSLYQCEKPDCQTEIIIVINSSENDPSVILRTNGELEYRINQWKQQHPDLTVHVINKENIPERYAGVGYARKTGMDEAVLRFHHLNKPEGVIMSLDADCLCHKDYFNEIEEKFCRNKTANLCILNFAHPLKGKEYSKDVYRSVTQYELYMRYYMHALKYTGFPHSYYTIGSCFGVKVDTYAKQGGMVIRPAGEDFYFIQKIIPLDHIVQIHKELVYPSPRPSNRVPFGTGPVIYELINTKEDYKTYDFKAFIILKQLFKNIDNLYNAQDAGESIISEFPEGLSEYLKEINFIELVKEVKVNTSNIESFRKRFYTQFNALRILQYLNFIHKTYLQHVSVKDAAFDLLKNMREEPIQESNEKDLLTILRIIDRKN